MIRRTCAALVACLLAGSAATSRAQEETAPEPTATPEAAVSPDPAAPDSESAPTPDPANAVPDKPPETLSQEAMQNAERLDSITVPTAGELLAGIMKVGKPDWQAGYRPPIPTSYTSRPQLALNLGGLIADGFLAVEAADSQRVKNTGKDVIELAKKLAVSQAVLGRANSIADFAEQNDWGTLKEEMEATQNEVKMAMQEQGDQDLVILVTLGGWIRGTEIVSSWIADNYTPESARLLRQPAIVAFMRSQISALPAKLQEDPLVATVSLQLVEIQELVSFSPDVPPNLESVGKLRDASAKLVTEISKKE